VIVCLSNIIDCLYLFDLTHFRGNLSKKRFTFWEI
jgi:hypothetical protein